MTPSTPDRRKKASPDTLPFDRRESGYNPRRKQTSANTLPFDRRESECNPQETSPFLRQLKANYQDAKQIALAQILEKDLHTLVSTYEQDDSIARVFQELTPKEIQIASMIKQGFSTKHIANTLSTSTETINVHRKNIRRKLGLDNQSINLRSFLTSFE